MYYRWYMFFDQIIFSTFIIIIIALDKYTLVTLKMYDVLSIVQDRETYDVNL